MSFKFRGTIPASKSILNRLLTIQSFAPTLLLSGESDADDVAKMRNGLKQVMRGEPADCGAAGTTLRFLALRASRLSGTHHLSGSLRLFERPQTELSRLISQLGCEAEIRLQRMTVRGQGWVEPSSAVVIDRSVSSQFASALFLNAWDLPFDLPVRFDGDRVSESYFKMSLELLRRAGMRIEISQTAQGELYVVKAGSRVTARMLDAEPDASSAFSLTAVAVARGGSVEIENWPAQSLQPDAVFVDLLRQMGCTVSMDGGVLRVEAAERLLPIEFDLRDAPDLFPVLAVLCSLANGRSRLFGAPHLAHKESDRIGKIAELIKSLGRKVRILPDGLEIEGGSGFPPFFKFSTDHDHRLAMAAAVAQGAGASLEILEPRVVDKSYPGFWQAIESGSN